jgi:anti-anti-sigma factor
VNLVKLTGEYDLARKAELETAFDSVPTTEPLTIDLSDVSYVDSTFLNVIASLSFRFQGIPITLRGSNQKLRRVLHLMSFDRLFRIVDD